MSLIILQCDFCRILFSPKALFLQRFLLFFQVPPPKTYNNLAVKLLLLRAENIFFFWKTGNFEIAVAIFRTFQVKKGINGSGKKTDKRNQWSGTLHRLTPAVMGDNCYVNYSNKLVILFKYLQLNCYIFKFRKEPSSGKVLVSSFHLNRVTI